MSNDHSQIEFCAPPDPEPRVPTHQLPTNSCDTHAHIIEPLDRDPMDPGRSYTPPPASLDAYQHLLATLGADRGVIVQPSVYGTDNRVTLDAVARGGDNYRAVVVVDDDCTIEQLDAFHAQGARGARVNLLFSSSARLDNLRALTGKMAEFGWHLQVLADVSTFDDLERFVKTLAVPVVFDHMGHCRADQAMAEPGFGALLRLMEAGQCWIKLSGAYRITGQTHTPYADVTPVARALIHANPERVVWGTDWPHPKIPVPMPNDGDLVDQMDAWFDNDDIRKQVFVDNPAQLYDFPR